VVRRDFLRSVVFAPLALGVAAGCYLLGRYVTLTVQAQRPAAAPEFAIEYVMVSFIQNPGGAVESETMVSQRSDGSRCERILQRPPGPPSTPTRHLFLADGRRIEINDLKRLRTTYRLSDEQLAHLKHRVAMRASRQICGRAREVMEGYSQFLDWKVEIWQTEFLTDNRQSVVRMTAYRAPELGCEELKLVQEEKAVGGKYTLKWTKDAREITLGPPSHQEMDVADSYAEVPPSEFLRHTHATAAMVLEAVETQRCKKLRCSEKERETIDKGYEALSEADQHYRRMRTKR
jgi:hypothetical protein